MDVGTEDTIKSSPVLSVHETAESRSPRKDLPMPSQTFRSVPHKRTSCEIYSVLFGSHCLCGTDQGIKTEGHRSSLHCFDADGWMAGRASGL